MRELQRWLEERGLGKIAAVLIEHDIDLDVLPDLTDADLEELGLLLGERKRLLKAAASLRSEPREATTAPQGPRRRDVVTSAAERRQVTILFCDLVGSSTLAEQLDPEDMGEVLRSYRQLCAKVIVDHEGTIVRYIGDGVLVCFGYPVAHEDDAIRAIRAGLEIVAELPELPVLRDLLGETTLSARIGIHTGMVVAGDLGHGDPGDSMDLVGGTPNIAARLQELAAPNAVTISGATRRLAEGRFVFDDLGARALKGIAEPVAVYQVRSESGVISRFEAATVAGLTPLVDREEEIALLHDRWRQAEAGEGQITLISGEPGIGKSRIVQALHERIAAQPHIRQRLQCSPHHTHSAFYPVIRHLEYASNFAIDDPPEVKRDKLTTMLGQSSGELDEDLQLIASLMSIPETEPSRLHNLSPERRKQRTIAALLRHMEALARQRALMLVFEDVHWIDPTSLELLDVAVDRAPELPILIVVTFRPEFAAPWRERPNLTSLTLNRLAPHDRTAIIERITGDQALPADVVKLIVARTDGVPLFLEEMTKAVLESAPMGRPGAADHPGALLQLPGIPATLYESLMARLDRLRGVKEVTQVAATIGRDFSKELLAAASSYPEKELEAALEQLVASGLILRRSIPPHAVFSFKHALIRDAAYESLLRSRRRELHARIAAALETRFPDVTRSSPELLAHHYTEADMSRDAVGHWLEAGRQATARSANVDAVTHLERGLALLKDLPAGAERATPEIELQLALGSALSATEGYAAPAVVQAFERARNLCNQVDDGRHLINVLPGLQSYYQVHGPLRTAKELGEQALVLAERSSDPAHLLDAHRRLGWCLFCMGELNLADAHINQAIAMYDRALHRHYAGHSGGDPGVHAYANASWIKWFQGSIDDAVQCSEAAVDLGRSIAYPLSLAYALGTAGALSAMRGESLLALQQAEAVIRVADDGGFPYWAAWGRIIRGWALAVEGETEEGLAELHNAIAAYSAGGGELIRPYALGLLADAYAKVGQPREALDLLVEGLQEAEENDIHFNRAELVRLRGEMLLAIESRSDDAERDFLEGIRIARQQGARSLELRACVSIAGLWLTQGKKDEAKQMLADIRASFAQCSTSPDMIAADKLLEQLDRQA
jgi:class 3 adenylate cyclase/tetratricopeptide (TPR) repeat protein